MKEFVNFIISQLVDNPDKLSIVDTYDQENNIQTLNIKAEPEDVGKIIGKKGKIINAVRNLVKVKAIREGKRVILNLA